MDAALLIARLVLGAVFTLAGVAKLSDLKGSRRAVIDFGVPSAIAAPLGLLLPVAELSRQNNAFHRQHFVVGA